MGSPQRVAVVPQSPCGPPRGALLPARLARAGGNPSRAASYYALEAPCEESRMLNGLSNFARRLASVADHLEQASSNWQDFPALTQWLEKCKVTAVPAAPVFNSLW